MLSQYCTWIFGAGPSPVVDFVVAASVDEARAMALDRCAKGPLRHVLDCEPKADAVALLQEPAKYCPPGCYCHQAKSPESISANVSLCSVCQLYGWSGVTKGRAMREEAQRIAESLPKPSIPPDVAIGVVTRAQRQRWTYGCIEFHDGPHTVIENEILQFLNSTYVGAQPDVVAIVRCDDGTHFVYFRTPLE